MKTCQLLPLLLLLLLSAVSLPARCQERQEELDEFNEDSDSDFDLADDTGRAKKFLVKTKACYGDLGCFPITGPYFSASKRPVIVVPQSPEEINIQFLLFTRQNPASHVELKYNNADSVSRSKFSKNRPTKLVVHGFMGNGIMAWVNEIRQAILKKADCNVIQVGWANGARTLYNQATSNTRVVGAVVGRMLIWLESRFGLKRSDVHIIGFSLGGQIAGYAGEWMRNHGGPISRITGLDPAGPYFEGTDPVVRLDPTDAQFVDVVHTDAGFFNTGLPVLSGGFGTESPVGHVDFFVNGGHHQPGCSSVSTCDHSRAPKLFISTVTEPEAAFAAFPCTDYDKFQAGVCGTGCPSGGCPSMGYYADKYRARFTAGGLPHNYYLLTGPAPPFALVHYHVAIRLSSTSTSGRSGELKVELSAGGRVCGPHLLAEKRDLEPSSTQRGVFGCDWPAKSALSKVRISWVDKSTFGSWLSRKITLDTVTLTEMVNSRVFRYCRFGSVSSGSWAQGSAC